MLKRSKRIHGRTLVQHILKEGTPHPGPFLNAISLPNELGTTRYAVIVGKKLAPSAVTRNRKRRQIYEIVRMMEQKVDSAKLPSLDIVLMVRSPAMKACFEDLQKGVPTTLRFLFS